MKRRECGRATRFFFSFSLVFKTLGSRRCYELILFVLGKLNYAQDKTGLNVCVNKCVRVCVCVPFFRKMGTSCARGPSSPLSASTRHQTELRPGWQSECRFHASDQRARWLCAPTTRGFTVPMMSGERELSGRGWREERRKGWKQQTRAVEK